MAAVTGGEQRSCPLHAKSPARPGWRTLRKPIWFRGRLLITPGGNPVPLENRNSGVDLRFVGASGGVRVFADQAAQDGFSEDLFAVEAGHGDAGSAGFVIGDALGDALVRPGCVVVRL